MIITKYSRLLKRTVRLRTDSAGWLLLFPGILLVVVQLFFISLLVPDVRAGDSSTSGPVETAIAPTAAPMYDFKIVSIYPHDTGAFTEGLVFDGGFLYESTGLKGKSSLRKVDLETGEVLRKHTLSASLFGEGLTMWNGRLIQLTWRNGIGFVYEKEGFARVREFQYPTEGWGLTQDGESLIMSDGSAVLRFLDPDTFAETGRIEVQDQGVHVTKINELEYIKGEIYANIWHTDYIARISPATGEVLGWIDLSNLRSALGPVQRVEVLNGIAYDAAGDRIFVTGKFWPRLFQIELVPRSN